MIGFHHKIDNYAKCHIPKLFETSSVFIREMKTTIGAQMINIYSINLHQTHYNYQVERLTAALH